MDLIVQKSVKIAGRTASGLTRELFLRPLRTAHLIQQFGSDERELESQIGILKSYNLIFQEGDRMLSLGI